MAEVRHLPGAGTRQGDPLSPAIFALVSSLVVYPLLERVSGVEVMMYTDDLLILFPYTYIAGVVQSVMGILQEFGDFFGIATQPKKKQPPSSGTWSQGHG
uniref:Reverse transcriptase domain-containing protein n=1 Tax=Eutreptiella gymnastica TaxID=73025 RepID=A0A7S4FW71_9EUGL